MHSRHSVDTFKKNVNVVWMLINIFLHTNAPKIFFTEIIERILSSTNLLLWQNVQNVSLTSRIDKIMQVKLGLQDGNNRKKKCVFLSLLFISPKISPQPPHYFPYFNIQKPWPNQNFFNQKKSDPLILQTMHWQKFLWIFKAHISLSSFFDLFVTKHRMPHKMPSQNKVKGKTLQCSLPYDRSVWKLTHKSFQIGARGAEA